ncbi:hypothetical protein Pd630_LPD05483 [Rhodococcus opacus PD630]|nr:hypothetical protein Pd630_LPD05483 [Rhodococcus opacus PD630]
MTTGIPAAVSRSMASTTSMESEALTITPCAAGSDPIERLDHRGCGAGYPELEP